MKMICSKSILMLASFLGLAFVASAEQAVTIHVPFAFSAGGKTLPAGDYVIHHSDSGMLIISGKAHDSGVVVTSIAGSSTATGDVGAKFDRTGGSASLTQVEFLGGETRELAGAR
jgi:hypothetical protein